MSNKKEYRKESKKKYEALKRLSKRQKKALDKREIYFSL